MRRRTGDGGDETSAVEATCAGLAASAETSGGGATSAPGTAVETSRWRSRT